ncbi:LacI family DNA-binding transcriptional regulator [Paenibacillus segetis]|uniref:LacI family transcriptional regulator n=1 Tax=Paenibacillus segetis TaxID=1325360 RepID=A0ABQ1YTB5_9BACL|nr:LacI family DNA-binding transcriptional regulator [Paenibacillus segetis]GGH35771.1 LacI family transcriptional regulator [Paenibacillus segetis]
MKRKMTSLDIANRLGLSRTTVSKALNGHEGIPDSTRERVLNVAAEIGYKHYGREMSLGVDGSKAKAVSGMPDASPAALRTIALLMDRGMAQQGYWVDVLRGVEEAASQNDCTMVLHFISPQDCMELKIPHSLGQREIDGIIAAGLFSKDYVKVLTALGLPTVQIDCHADVHTKDMICDTVMMESEQSVYELTNHLISLGHTRIGFIGDIQNCLSFHERWFGFTRALIHANLPLLQSCCAITPVPGHYFDIQEVSGSLEVMPELPSAFVCANDLVARQVKKWLLSQGLRVPRDVSITGFDLLSTGEESGGGNELTSVRVNGSNIGARAFEQLLWRAQRRNRPAENIRLACSVEIGDSTSFIASNPKD